MPTAVSTQAGKKKAKKKLLAKKASLLVTKGITTSSKKQLGTLLPRKVAPSSHGLGEKISLPVCLCLWLGQKLLAMASKHM